MTHFKVNTIVEEIEYTEKQIKIARAEKDRRWIITLKNGTKYEVYGTFNSVLEVCNIIDQNPISVISERYQPTLLAI